MDLRVKHGLRSHKLYNVHSEMILRTTNRNHKNYDRYGGRGIKVCDEWINDFTLFYDWCIKNGYKDGLSIDRINNDGNYEPLNCRFVNSNIQNRNNCKIRKNNKSGFRGVSLIKRSNKWNASIRVNGKTKHIGNFKYAYDAALAYDKYVSDNKLEHTVNFNHV